MSLQSFVGTILLLHSPLFAPLLSQRLQNVEKFQNMVRFVFRFFRTGNHCVSCWAWRAANPALKRRSSECLPKGLFFKTLGFSLQARIENISSLNFALKFFSPVMPKLRKMLILLPLQLPCFSMFFERVQDVRLSLIPIFTNNFGTGMIFSKIPSCKHQLSVRNPQTSVLTLPSDVWIFDVFEISKAIFEHLEGQNASKCVPNGL